MGFAFAIPGWLLIFVALISGAVYGVASDYELYYKEQLKAGVPEYAGFSQADLLELDERIASYLFTPMNADSAIDNREMSVRGEMCAPLNERERAHLRDCRRLLSPTGRVALYLTLLGAGAALVFVGKRRVGAAWIAAAVIFVPLAALALWAALDFDSAFTCFHKILFSNDLWLLDPQTDLLIRICPASMFASMGLRIAARCVIGLAGLPAAYMLLLKYIERRKRIK